MTPSYSVEGSFTSLPWGDGHASTGTDTDAAHFAQLDHDNESDTDHADFRQYAGKVGRFISPDPYDGSYDPSNPQSMNRYVYAMNSPLSNVDPTGRDWHYNQSTGCWDWTWEVALEGGNLQAGVQDSVYCGGAGGSGGSKYTPPTTINIDDSGGIVALDNGTPKSTARQQCEANANANLKNAEGKVVEKGAIGLLVGGATSMAYSAGKGCLIAGGAAALFGLETGPLDLGVAAGGCAAGAVDGIYKGAVDMVYKGVFSGVVTSGISAWGAYSDYRKEMQACSAL